MRWCSAGVFAVSTSVFNWCVLRFSGAFGAVICIWDKAVRVMAVAREAMEMRLVMRNEIRFIKISLANQSWNQGAPMARQPGAEFCAEIARRGLDPEVPEQNVFRGCRSSRDAGQTRGAHRQDDRADRARQSEQRNAGGHAPGADSNRRQRDGHRRAG